MFYFEYPTTDTTLYEGSVTSSRNTGLDEILEVRKEIATGDAKEKDFLKKCHDKAEKYYFEDL